MDGFWSFLERPLTQTGVAMVLAVIGTIVPSKVAMIVAGLVLLFAAYREGWFKGRKWYVSLGRVVASVVIVTLVLATIWEVAWRFRERPAQMAQNLPSAVMTPPQLPTPAIPPKPEIKKPHKKPSLSNQEQSGRDNVQTGSITQGCGAIQQGGFQNQANVNCTPPPARVTTTSTVTTTASGIHLTTVAIRTDQDISRISFRLTFDGPIGILDDSVSTPFLDGGYDHIDERSGSSKGLVNNVFGFTIEREFPANQTIYVKVMSPLARPANLLDISQEP